MATTKFVTTGEKASIFHDQTTGITVLSGQVVELNAQQLNSKRIRMAIASGHLVYAVSNNPKDVSTIDEEKAKALTEKFKSYHKSGVDSKKIKKVFNMEELKAIAKSMDIEPEDGDTEDTLITAIIEDLSKSSKTK